jgi:hypothetical protein
MTAKSSAPARRISSLIFPHAVEIGNPTLRVWALKASIDGLPGAKRATNNTKDDFDFILVAPSSAGLEGHQGSSCTGRPYQRFPFMA